MPIGDIQFGMDTCDVDLLKRNVERGMRADAYFIGMGDYVDVASPSNRAALRSVQLYDSTRAALDEAVTAKEDQLAEILVPTAGRWLGLLSGHHYFDHDDGTTSDTRLAQRLDAIHLGDCSLTRVSFADGNRHVASCTIWSHHGQGSGANAAAPLNKLEKVVQWVEADLYLMGHQHKRVAASIPRFYMIGERAPLLVARERLIVCTGSYLKGYMQGSADTRGIPTGTYVEQKMLAPVMLGSPLITIRPTRVNRRGNDFSTLEFEVSI